MVAAYKVFEQLSINSSYFKISANILFTRQNAAIDAFLALMFTIANESNNLINSLSKLLLLELTNSANFTESFFWLNFPLKRKKSSSETKMEL